MKAIGLLETKGLIGNIEGLDAMVKAAQVDYVGGLTLGAGLVAIVVTGDVGAVKASVAAGAAAQAIGTVVSCHVIPRPHGAVGETMPDMKYGEGHV